STRRILTIGSRRSNETSACGLARLTRSPSRTRPSVHGSVFRLRSADSSHRSASRPAPRSIALARPESADADAGSPLIRGPTGAAGGRRFAGAERYARLAGAAARTPGTHGRQVGRAFLARSGGWDLGDALPNRRTADCGRAH